jgi:hypothetical protein
MNFRGWCMDPVPHGWPERTDWLRSVFFWGMVPNINSHGQGQMVWTLIFSLSANIHTWVVWRPTSHHLQYPWLVDKMIKCKRWVFFTDFKIVMGCVSMEYLVPPNSLPWSTYRTFALKMPYIGRSIDSLFLAKHKSIVCQSFLDGSIANLAGLDILFSWMLCPCLSHNFLWWLSPIFLTREAPKRFTQLG